MSLIKNVVYIGQTDDLNARIGQHQRTFENYINTSLYNHMRKSGGWDNFQFINLEDNIRSNKINGRESQYIKQYGVLQRGCNMRRAPSGPKAGNKRHIVYAIRQISFREESSKSMTHSITSQNVLTLANNILRAKKPPADIMELIEAVISKGYHNDAAISTVKKVVINLIKNEIPELTLETRRGRAGYTRFRKTTTQKEDFTSLKGGKAPKRQKEQPKQLVKPQQLDGEDYKAKYFELISAQVTTGRGKDDLIEHLQQENQSLRLQRHII